jgi:LacI family transcriptional regulator
LKRATIADVAAAAGVSPGTASKALNGRGKLRPQTRKRVEQAAQRLGFAPSTLAQVLVTGRSFTVGLVAAGLSRVTFPVMIGAEDALGNCKVSAFACSTRDDRERERRQIELLSARQVDGLVIVGSRIEARPPAPVPPGIPVVYAMTRPAGGRGPAVLPDDEGGGATAAEHLLRLGRRRIAHVTGPRGSLAARLRARGFATALESAGAAQCGRTLYGDWSEAWGREAAGQLLTSRPDAIFCGSDRIARGAADMLRAVHRRVPQDVALVGFDDWTPMALGALPHLTSIDPCLEEVGRDAAARLIALIGGEPRQGVHVVPGRLVVRESTDDSHASRVA